MTDDDVRILALVKPSPAGKERYVFGFADTDEDRAELLRQFGRFASNPALSFTWYDAACLSAAVRDRKPAPDRPADDTRPRQPR